MSRGPRRGVDVLLEVLRTEGVTHVFGNPGSTELPLVQALAGSSDIEFVLALQEASVIGMAEGFARASGRAAFANVHTNVGLGNAMGNLVNAATNRTPIVVTAGHVHRAQALQEPLLFGDLPALAKSVSRSATQVERTEDLGLMVRRAFLDAQSAPAGPAFLSLPYDVLDEETAVGVPPRTDVDRRVVPSRLGEVADRLVGDVPSGVGIVAGDEVAHHGAVEAVVDLAEALGVPVHAASLHASAVFPQDHPLFADTFTPTAAGMARALASYRTILLIGAHPLLAYHYTAEAAVPEGVEVIQLSSDPTTLARYHSPHLALLGDPKLSVEELVRLVKGRVDRDERDAAVHSRGNVRSSFLRSMEDKALARYSARPASPMAAAHAAIRAIPPDVPVVEEAITAGYYVRRFIREWHPGKYHFNRGGGLGWAMPYSVGVSIGRGHQPVLCVVGDGASLYSPQAMWTAAHLAVPVTFLVLNNRQYRILKDNMRNEGRTSPGLPFVGMDLDQPPVDIGAIATALGVPSLTADSAADLGDVLVETMKAAGPTLVEIVVTDEG